MAVRTTSNCTVHDEAANPPADRSEFEVRHRELGHPVDGQPGVHLVDHEPAEVGQGLARVGAGEGIDVTGEPADLVGLLHAERALPLHDRRTGDGLGHPLVADVRRQRDDRNVTPAGVGTRSRSPTRRAITGDPVDESCGRRRRSRPTTTVLLHAPPRPIGR